MDDLAGKTAVITGAASGLGKAFATRFAAADMNVVLADVEEPALDLAVDELRDGGAAVIGVVTDVSDGASVERLLDQSLAAFGRVNVLCNNAGVVGASLIGGRIIEADWRWVLGVNLWGVIHGHRVFLPHLLEHGDGHIVNTASMAGHIPGHSPYMASKWAVVGITEGLYSELANLGSTVGVSCLCPGWVNTAIDSSTRNRPEWAASALEEPNEIEEAVAEYVRDQVRSGMEPAKVADLVHDAIVDERFWIFTDPKIVASLEERYRAILDGTNPPIRTMA